MRVPILFPAILALRRNYLSTSFGTFPSWFVNHEPAPMTPSASLTSSRIVSTHSR